MGDQNPQNVQTPEATQPETEMTVKDTGNSLIVETTKPEVQMPDPDAAPTEELQEKPAEEQPQDLEERFQQQQTAEQEIKSELAKADIDFDALAAEYDKNGSLSAESLTALEKAGYPKAVVDAYLAGLEAMADSYAQQVRQMAGGDEAYAQLVQFISTQPQSVIDGFNAAIQTGSLAQIQLSINGIRAQMTAAYGTAKPSVMAGAQGAGTPAGYQTTAEMTKDMADPRYQTDPVFTQEVYRKLQNSSLF